MSNNRSCSIWGGEWHTISSRLLSLGGVSCPNDADVQWGDELSGDLTLKGLPSNEEGDTSRCCLEGGEKEGDSMDSMDGRRNGGALGVAKFTSQLCGIYVAMRYKLWCLHA